MLHHVAFQLSHPPANPHGLPHWALHPRGLYAELLAHMSLGVDKNWKYVVNEMINNRVASRNSDETTTEDGEVERKDCDKSSHDDNDGEEAFDAHGGMRNHDAGDELEDGNQFVEREDDRQAYEGNEQSAESDDDKDQPEGGELSEKSDDGSEFQGDEWGEGDLENVKRKKSRASNSHSSETLPSTEGQTLAGKAIGDPLCFPLSEISEVCRYSSLRHYCENVPWLLNDAGVPEAFPKNK